MRLLIFMPIGVFLLLAGCADRQTDSQRFLLQGNRVLAAGEHDRALHFYSEAIKKDPQFVEAWYNRGLVYMELQQYDEALAGFDRALALKPGYGEALLSAIEANLAVRQYYAALDLAGRLGAVWPDSAVTPFARGLALAGLDRSREALSAFRAASRLDTTNAEPLANIANIYYRQRQYDSAWHYLQEAIRLKADLPEAYNILAMVLAGKGNWQEALQAIDLALSFAPGNAYFLNNKGYILLHLDKAAEAEELLRLSMRIDPLNAWVYRNLGLLRLRQGNAGEAVRLLSRARDMDAGIMDIDYDLARALLADDRSREACRLLQKTRLTEEEARLRQSACR